MLSFSNLMSIFLMKIHLIRMSKQQKMKMSFWNKIRHILWTNRASLVARIIFLKLISKSKNIFLKKLFLNKNINISRNKLRKMWKMDIALIFILAPLKMKQTLWKSYMHNLKNQNNHLQKRIEMLMRK
jgi:hypothetical protein